MWDPPFSVYEKAQSVPGGASAGAACCSVCECVYVLCLSVTIAAEEQTVLYTKGNVLSESTPEKNNKCDYNFRPCHFLFGGNGALHIFPGFVMANVNEQTYPSTVWASFCRVRVTFDRSPVHRGVNVNPLDGTHFLH